MKILGDTYSNLFLNKILGEYFIFSCPERRKIWTLQMQ